MSRVVVVRYRVRPEHARRNVELIEDVFAALHEARPDGIRYAALREDDGCSFLHVAEIDGPPDANPLAAIPAFAAFTAGIAGRCAVQPQPAAASVVGGYRAFEALARS